MYAVYDYDSQNHDELSFKEGERIIIIRKEDEQEQGWWWSRIRDREGYVPRNLLGVRLSLLLIIFGKIYLQTKSYLL